MGSIAQTIITLVTVIEGFRRASLNTIFNVFLLPLTVTFVVATSTVNTGEVPSITPSFKTVTTT